MYEKEEKKLRTIKQNYDELDIPVERLDNAIQLGMTKSRQTARHKWKPWLISVSMAAILILSLLTAIRVSPAVASYVSILPGMEKIIERISTDKGLIDAVNHNYIQEVGVTDEYEGLKVTVDSLIVDEQQMKVFYSVEGTPKKDEFQIIPSLQTLDGNDLEASTTFADANLEGGKAELEATFYFNEPHSEKERGLDVIVSNPPYIRSADMATLDAEVRDHDPHRALDGGPDGLDAYREIIPAAAGLLAPGGWLVVEVGYDQDQDVGGIMREAGFALPVPSQPDLAGIRRAVLGKRTDR